MSTPFFVYGTLKPGESNYERLLSGRTAAEIPARLEGAALYSNGAYPYLVIAPDADAEDVAHGYLIYPADAGYPAVLAELDHLEGYVEGRAGNEYERVAVQTLTADGPVEAWVYVAGATPLARIRRGELQRIGGGVW